MSKTHAQAAPAAPAKARPTPIQGRRIFWVDVQDHLPGDDRCVLIHAPSLDSREFPVFMGWFDPTEDGWRTMEAMPIDAGAVTHWAELPEPPEL